MILTSLKHFLLHWFDLFWNLIQAFFSPYYETHINHLESVQKQFLLFALKSLNWDPTVNLPSYESRLKLLNMPTLKSRRIMLNISFLHKLINGEVSSTFLLGRAEFKVPLRSLRIQVELVVIDQTILVFNLFFRSVKIIMILTAL